MAQISDPITTNLSGKPRKPTSKPKKTPELLEVHFSGNPEALLAQKDEFTLCDHGN